MWPFAVSVGQFFGGDGFVAVTIACLAFFGWRHGTFVATLACFQVLVSFVVALGLAGVAVESLRAMEFVPPGRTLAIAYATIFLGCFVGLRLAIGAFVPEMAVPLSPPIDAIGGVSLGALAGYMLAGAGLVAWSLASLPGAWRFSSESRGLDPGASMVRAFARCIEPDPIALAELLRGNGGLPSRPDAPRCSEPFLDLDADAVRDEEEPFGDVDGDRSFTGSLGFDGTRPDRRRRLGLLECYRLGDWERITVAHAPECTSAERERLAAAPVPAETLYQATARDADGTAALTFSLRATDRGGAPAAVVEELAIEDLQIDPATGCVLLTRDITGQKARQARFTVVVTDSTGLTDERRVLVTW